MLRASWSAAVAVWLGKEHSVSSSSSSSSSSVEEDSAATTGVVASETDVKDAAKLLFEPMQFLVSVIAPLESSNEGLLAELEVFENRKASGAVRKEKGFRLRCSIS